MASFVMDVLEKSITFDVERSKRRKSRIGINFEAGDRVRLESPARTTVAELQAMVTQHERWFAHRLQRAAAENPIYQPPQYRHGELLLHQGRPLELQVCFGCDQWQMANRGGLFEDRSPKVVLHGAVLRIFAGEVGIEHSVLTEPEIRDLVRLWQVQRAREVLADSVRHWVETIDWLQQAPDWRLRYMRTQWGSCSESGRISLNTHLVKLPKATIDYVVLHELCHLQHLDHSPRFHALVEHYLPDWRGHIGVLNRYAGLLGET